MSTKIVNICIPECEQLPDIVSSSTPEENYLMLKIGSDFVKESRKLALTLNEKDIYNKVKNELKTELEQYKHDINKLQLDLLVQKRVHNESRENATKIYEEYTDNLQQEIFNLQKKLSYYTYKNTL